jgi:hypothetical protein
MALIIKPTENKKIVIAGTTLELPEIYVRLEFAARADGKKIEVAFLHHTTKETYLQGIYIHTNVKDETNQNLFVELLETETQSVETAHKYAKLAFEQLGYTVETTLDNA